MKAATTHRIRLGGRLVGYRLVLSRAARRLRVRVGPGGIEVVQPAKQKGEDVTGFLDRNTVWILAQLKRVERLHGLQRSEQRRAGDILFRGEPTHVQIERTKTRARGNRVAFIDGEIVVHRGAASRTPAARSLQNWLRKQARAVIDNHLAVLTARLRQRPERVYVMGQRTKWGNCSARKNLSFNWRLILAPDFVLRYMVTHEAVHLAVPDHSAKFWLTVQSHCPETERAKRWLSANHWKLVADMGSGFSLRTANRSTNSPSF